MVVSARLWLVAHAMLLVYKWSGWRKCTLWLEILIRIESIPCANYLRKSAAVPRRVGNPLPEWRDVATLASFTQAMNQTPDQLRFRRQARNYVLICFTHGAPGSRTCTGRSMEKIHRHDALCTSSGKADAGSHGD